jgi:peptidyl-prolyl cis-trans isomerase C
MIVKKRVSKSNEVSALVLSVLATGILVSVMASGNAKETAPASDPGVRAVAARVNGAPIYEDELAPEMKKAFRKYQKFGRKEPTPELSEVLWKRALDKLISVELLYQAAGKGLDIPGIEERIDKQFQTLQSRQGSQHESWNESEWKESIRKNIYIKQYLKSAGVVDPEVPEAEIKEYWEEHKNSFTRDELVHVRHILVLVAEGATPEDKAKAREKIDQARREILGGKRFAQTAKEYSEDNIASAGGDLGYIKRGYMPKEFDEVAFKLRKNTLSDVVLTRHGYHIVEVLDKQPAGVTPYDEIRDFIGRYLKNELARLKQDAVIKSLRAKAKIELIAK